MSHLRPKGEFKNVSSDVFAKAKQMVLHGDIAPFEVGCDCEDCVGGAQQLEECSICFLSFPALNRTKCCSKGICSNCFFAVKTTDYRHEDAPPRTLRHLLLGNCPFCKCKPFEVQFKGRRSAEERQRELEEDKRVQLALRRKREEDIRSSLSGSVLIIITPFIIVMENKSSRRTRTTTVACQVGALVLKHLSSPMERDARADLLVSMRRKSSLRS